MEQVSNAVVEHREHSEQQTPEWIEGLLKARFFVACAAHPYIANSLNKYCITCRMSGCHYCMTSGNRHSHHDILQVYGHVHRDAVLLSEMVKHLDCREILRYKNNQSVVIALKPPPYGSGLNKFTCKTCEARVGFRYSYCCLHCKVAAMSSKSSGASSSAPPCNGDQTSPNKKENEKRVAESGSTLHKRKGKPYRAPFY